MILLVYFVLTEKAKGNRPGAAASRLRDEAVARMTEETDNTGCSTLAYSVNLLQH